MNKIKEVTKSKDPETYLGFTDKQKTKGKRFARKVALAASLIAALASAGCVTSQDEPTNTLPPTTIEVPPTFTPKPTIEVTPVVTPTPTPTEVSTYDPKGLNSYDDAFNDDVINYETQRLVDNYLSSTFMYSVNDATWELMYPAMKWVGIPDGQINEEAFNEAFHQIYLNDLTEIHYFTRLLRGEITVDPQELKLNSIEPLFINNSEEEKIYLNLLERKREFIISAQEGSMVETIQETFNYIYTDFVLSDKIFQGVNDPLYKYLILDQIANLDAMANLAVDGSTNNYKVYNNVDGSGVDILNYWHMYDSKLEMLRETIVSEIILNRENSIKSLKN